MEKLRVGIAGYGIVGKRRRQVIDGHPAMRTVAVCDRKFESNGILDDGVAFFQNYRSLLSQNLDVLFVCMTNDIAPEVTIAGLESGLHVFCEKPPGRTVNDIVRVIEEERKHPKQKLKFGFNHRYHESVQEALRIFNARELGPLINLRGVYGKSKMITFNQDNWRTHRSIAGGGVLLDQGIHLVDLMRLFAGEFDEIHSFVSNDFWKHDVEDNAYALMRTRLGVVALFHSSATQWRHRFQLEMTFEKGNIILSGILSGSKSYGAETLSIVWANPENDAGDPKEQTTRYNEDPSWKREVNEFADAILSGGEISNGSSDDALKTMQLVYRIYCADPNWRSQYNLTCDITERINEPN
jgi:predicted dehydrogenase